MVMGLGFGGLPAGAVMEVWDVVNPGKRIRKMRQAQVGHYGKRK